MTTANTAAPVEPAIVLIVADEEGNVVRRITGPVKAGFQRVSWDLRYPPPSPIELTEPEPDVFQPPPPGPLAAPGKYTVRLAKRIDGVETNLGDAQTFNVVPLYLNVMQESDRAAVLEFQKSASKLQRAVMGADKVTADALSRCGVPHRLQAGGNLFSVFLGFFAWYAGMARAGIAKASQVQLAQPALSMVWGWPLLGEHLSIAAIITIAVVLAAVVVGRNAVVHTSQPIPAAVRDATLM